MITTLITLGAQRTTTKRGVEITTIEAAKPVQVFEIADSSDIDHSRHCGELRGLSSTASGPVTWILNGSSAAPQWRAISPRAPTASRTAANAAVRGAGFRHAATPGNKSKMTAYQTPGQSLSAIHRAASDPTTPSSVPTLNLDDVFDPYLCTPSLLPR